PAPRFAPRAAVPKPKPENAPPAWLGSLPRVLAASGRPGVLDTPAQGDPGLPSPAGPDDPRRAQPPARTSAPHGHRRRGQGVRGRPGRGICGGGASVTPARAGKEPRAEEEGSEDLPSACRLLEEESPVRPWNKKPGPRRPDSAMLQVPSAPSRGGCSRDPTLHRLRPR
ncbi:hypothetical protein P7K49_029138, partial [Saguinus oedipus]